MILKRMNYFKKKFKNARILLSNPHKRGVVHQIRITTPRKPNSAKRKTVQVLIYQFKRLAVSYVPGGSHNLKKSSKVIIEGHGPKDLPAVNTVCLRGVLDLTGVLHKTKRRSIYGVKKKNE